MFRPSIDTRRISLILLLLPSLAIAQDSPTELDAVSVTATREERATKEVPASISIIGEEKLETSRMFSISDALSGTPGVLVGSRRGGYDTRLIIRGSGLKASYGVREVMVLRDGVPITDPDSFTRLDFIDNEDIEQIEITKGPGSLYAAGSAGGTIQVNTPPALAGSFKLRLKVGLIGHSADSCREQIHNLLKRLALAAA